MVVAVSDDSVSAGCRFSGYAVQLGLQDVHKSTKLGMCLYPWLDILSIRHCASCLQPRARLLVLI